MTILGGHNRPVWPDEGGTPTLPTTAFVRSSRIIDVEEASEMHPRVTISGVAMPHLAVDVLVTFDPVESTTGTSWRRYARRVVQGATLGTHDLGPVHLPARCRAVLDARGWIPDVDTRMVITADMRRPGSEASVDGQPLELAGHQVNGVECWGNGSGGSATMAGAYAAAPPGAAAQQWLPTGEADTLVVDFTVTTQAPDVIDIEVRERPLGSTAAVEQVAVNSVISGVVEQQIAQERVVAGALDTYRFREIPVRPGTEILILAQYGTGAKVPAPDGLGIARLYRLGPRG